MVANALVRDAAQLLANSRYLSLGTTNKEIPWVAPVAYVVGPKLELLFYSATDSRHACDLATNPIVAGAIFDSSAPSATVRGLQFQAQTSMVEPAQLPAMIEHYFQSSFPNAEERARWQRGPEAFSGDAPQRFYQLEMTQLYITDPASTLIDKRLAVDLPELRSLWHSLV